MKKGFLILFVLLFGILQGAAMGADKVTLRLNWNVYGEHAGFFYGLERGFYKDEGIDLTIGVSQGSGQTVKLIGTKNDPFGYADAATVAFFDAAVAAHPGAASVARWLLNELAGLAGERSIRELPLTPSAFGAFVALVDAGKATPAAAKTLLADLVANGGEPEARLAALGLAKVEDAGAVAAAVDRALAAQAAEVARYRAGEKKLFGLLVGAAMREAKGADAALVRKLLTEK